MKIITTNRKAYHNYFIEDTYEAGIELLGWEVKSARAANINLNDSFVFIEGGQVFLKNAHFGNYEYGDIKTQETRRSRRLLLKKAQIEKLYSRVKAKGYTLAPTKMYLTPSGLIKVEIALARGKQLHDKKDALKQQDLKRDAEKQIHNFK